MAGFMNGIYVVVAGSWNSLEWDACGRGKATNKVGLTGSQEVAGPTVYGIKVIPFFETRTATTSATNSAGTICKSFMAGRYRPAGILSVPIGTTSGSAGLRNLATQRYDMRLALIVATLVT